MKIDKFYSVGLMSLKEGMTFVINTYDEDGTLIGGTPNPEKSLFKCKEITKEQYDAYMQMLKNPNTPLGLAGGILNEEGKRDLENYIGVSEERRIQSYEPKIVLSVKKIKKLLALEIIEEGDIDTEIEQQGMKEFADEIKRRLAE